MSNKNAHVLVGGDFNCGDIECSTMQVPEGVPKRPVQTKLVDIIQDHCLSQMVNINTREDKTLDFLFTNSTSQGRRRVLKSGPAKIRSSAEGTRGGEHERGVSPFL